MTEETLNKRIVTNPNFPVRFSYFKGIAGKMVYNEAKSKAAGVAVNERIWSTMILIPKRDEVTITKFKNVINAVAREKWGDNIPSNLKVSFRDGDKAGKGGVPDGTEAGAEPYGGHYFMSVKSDRQPGVLDQNKEPIIDPTAIASGDYGCVSVNCFPFDNKFGKGISFGLGNIQLVKKGEPLGGAEVSADDEFKPISQAEGAQPVESAAKPAKDDVFNVG